MTEETPKIKVQLMESEKGNFVKNAFIIHTDQGKFLQSYDDTIAFVSKDDTSKIQVSKNFWNFTPTSLKHLENFLEKDFDIIRWDVQNMEILLVEL